MKFMRNVNSSVKSAPVSGSEITGPFINNLIKSAPGKLGKPV